MGEDKANQSTAHVPLGEDRWLWLATDLHTFKAVSETTNGAFSLSELTAQPQFGPPHIDHREDESFYVLEGEFEFLDNDHTFTPGAGAFV